MDVRKRSSDSMWINDVTNHIKVDLGMVIVLAIMASMPICMKMHPMD